MSRIRVQKFLAGLAFISAFALTSCNGDKKPTVLPPSKVEVITTKTENVPVYTEFVGQVYGSSDIAIRARVEGFLESMHFKEGQPVEKGQLLYTIDPLSYQATVAARMSDVAAAKTQMVKADNDLKRIRPLAEKNAVSQSDLDAAVASYEASQASVDAAKANLNAAQIQLGYTKIYSPVSGLIGVSQAKVGDFVGQSPNAVVLNEVSDIDTVRVRVYLSEPDYLTMARFISSLDSVERRLRRNEQKEERNYLSLILTDGVVYKEKGKFDFVDRNIDPTTGSIMVQTSFANPMHMLRPGMFAKIKAQIQDYPEAIVVPQRCVSELQGLHQVVVVKADSTILIKDVVVGPKVESGWIIKSGLEAGETVVYEGLQRVKSGLKVIPVPASINQKSNQ